MLVPSTRISLPIHGNHQKASKIKHHFANTALDQISAYLLWKIGLRITVILSKGMSTRQAIAELLLFVATQETEIESLRKELAQYPGFSAT
jgi:hypothetical protein